MSDPAPHWHQVTTEMYVYDDHWQVLRFRGKWGAYRDGIAVGGAHDTPAEAMEIMERDR